MTPVRGAAILFSRYAALIAGGVIRISARGYCRPRSYLADRVSRRDVESINIDERPSLGEVRSCFPCDRVLRVNSSHVIDCCHIPCTPTDARTRACRSQRCLPGCRRAGSCRPAIGSCSMTAISVGRLGWTSRCTTDDLPLRQFCRNKLSRSSCCLESCRVRFVDPGSALLILY